MLPATMFFQNCETRWTLSLVVGVWLVTTLIVVPVRPDTCDSVQRSRPRRRTRTQSPFTNELLPTVRVDPATPVTDRFTVVSLLSSIQQTGCLRRPRSVIASIIASTAERRDSLV